MSTNEIIIVSFLVGFIVAVALAQAHVLPFG